MTRFWMMLAATLCISHAAWAQHAKVEAVQYPAWLERGGRAVPLTPGTVLQSQDRGVFEATLSVIAGAFRFTGQALGRKRDISIKVRNATAGIRGTDLWGKSTEERDIVCLIEGRISVGSEGHPTVTLDQPLDFYSKPRDGAPQVAKVDARQLETWAAETEIAPDGAAARAEGKWRVVAGVYANRDTALKLNRLLRTNGYPSSVVRRDADFAVQVAGLAGEPQARALMAGLRRLPGVELPKVEEGP